MTDFLHMYTLLGHARPGAGPHENNGNFLTKLQTLYNSDGGYCTDEPQRPIYENIMKNEYQVLPTPI